MNEFNQPVGKLIENWMPVKRPDLKLLKGNYCFIEPINVMKHAKQLFENFSYDNRGESWTYLPYGPFESIEVFCDWINETQAMFDTELYAILNQYNEAIGIAGYLRINPEHGVIEIGHIHFSKHLQKTPAATEAMYLMMKYAIEDLGYRRYEWKCNTLNQASQDAALRLGFKFEGIFRQSHVLKNRNRDTAWFSIIDSEWPDLKRKFEAWLDPNNFDNSGKQQKSLNAI